MLRFTSRHIRCFSAKTNLAQKLSSELDFEKSNPLTSLSAPKGWSIKEHLGSKEVTLTKTIGNQNVSIFFTTDDVIAEEEEQDSTTTSLTVVLDKPHANVGALELNGTIDEGNFYWEFIRHMSSKDALEESADGDHRRGTLYSGPMVDTLDEDLNESFYAYISDLGFDTELAEFIQEYAQLKETKEYQNWLEKTKSFIAA